jgi:hypothetical protein
LINVLGENPKVLFLNCHGDSRRKENGKITSFFCFESVEEKIAMLEEFNEEKLTELLKAKNWGV